MNPSLHIYNNAGLPFINPNFEIELVAGDCQFTEGPLWNPEGFYLFSDTTANVVYKLTPGQPKQVYIQNSGTDKVDDEALKPGQAGSNAMAYTKNGSLLVCRHGSHDIAKWNGTSLTPFIDNYQGKPLNSPNDLVVDSKDRVFFSDPPYGLKDGQLNPERFQSAAGVYCSDNGPTTLICDKYLYPNGVCITPAGDELYICSNKPFEQFVSVYDTTTLQYKRVLIHENSDGIKCDPQGHVYLCNKDGVIIINAAGDRLALLAFPTVPANICWGGYLKKDLLICARQNVFLIRDLLV